MWDTLHSAAFALDKKNINIDHLVEPLRRILPCRYCRDSFGEFYKALGKPQNGLGLEWTYRVHNLVNEKLAKQRLQAFAEKHGTIKNAFGHVSELNVSPTFEVIQKRLLVNSDELFTWKALSVVLLALAMSNADENSLSTFVSALQKAIIESRQPNASMLVEMLDDYLDTSDKRLFIDTLKYGKNKKNSDLIRAGSCVAGTCK
jgi:hypothetical protein